MQKEIIVNIKNMNKNFGATKALKNVNLEFCRGEIRGLVGENGSGKSTVTSIISGMQKATSGHMFYKGEPWDPDTMVEAQRKGISMILQEANTIPNCTVAENIFAGRMDEFSRFGIINMKQIVKQADILLKKHGIEHIKANDNINKYGLEDRKLIEIVRCVTDETEVLIVDETTTVLSLDGRKLLYKIIHKLKNANKTVVFISHDMDEILSQCTDITVLRDGIIIGQLTSEELKAANAVQRARFMMVGREIGDSYYRSDYDSSHEEEVVLEFDRVSLNHIKEFSLKLHKGEIIGFGGLSGCGMRDIGRAAYGLEKIKSGQVLSKGKKIENSLQAIRSGIGYISKNRDTEALILQGSIADNIVMPSLSSISKGTYISPKIEKAIAKKEIEAFRIKCNNRKQWVNTLSGGNKQKVSFAKWTAMGSDVFIMDCPTRGVDIGVKKAMYELIYNMKKQGKAIILISEELSELIGMSDKLIIMKDSKVTKEFIRSADLKETDIIEYMI